MKIPFIATIVFLLLAIGAWTGASDSPAPPVVRTPVLVELFTSEGCSSCPPADAYLQQLDRQPIAGEQLIVLSEHVDYWNHIGWKDPYSARLFSDRQSSYANRFGLESVYTPQMVVDGTSEFTGGDSSLANRALGKALHSPKIGMRLSSVSPGPAGTLKAHLEAGELSPSFALREAEVYVAIALDHAESQVAGGENAGRKLSHTAVVRSIIKVGTLQTGRSFSQDLQLKLDPEQNARAVRVVAFVQEPHQGRIVGACMILVGNSLVKVN